MFLEKCKYYNNHQTACTLMIDDLVPVAVSANGKIGANNDWGYLLDDTDSLFSYFQKNLLTKYPEIKGTVFLPLESQKYIEKESGYQIFRSNVENSDFTKFLHRIKPHFKMAFHGVKHVFFDDIKKKYVHECSNLNKPEVYEINEKVKSFYKKTNIKFIGGKFPGYKYNQIALELLNSLNAKWWALDMDMMNKESSKNKLILDNEKKITYIPTNIAGNIFTASLKPELMSKTILKRILKNKFHKNPIGYIFYLYENGLPITIQEHFQNQRTDGKRQTPNIYDDIWSLDQIYGIIRPLDIWHATCGEIAHYHDSYVNSSIKMISDEKFSIYYHGSWDDLFLSIETDMSKIFHIESNRELKGLSKNGKYIYNSLKPGCYRICH